MADPRKPIFDAVREARGKGFTRDDVLVLDHALDKLGVARAGSEPDADPQDPPWLATARSLIGTREIPGPRHNPWIAKAWARLGAAWFNDDETPWCGLFVAHCLDAAGLPYPKQFPRAASYRDYGTEVKPQLGAIGVKARKGGNHVFFIAGETRDKQYYKALGGNQGNMVSIVDIPKSSVDAVRWPPNVAVLNMPLPIMARGTIAGSEA